MSKAGFAAVITKDHDYSGVVAAALISKHYPHLRTRIYSSIVLNNVVGGFNPYAVEHTAAMGGKIVFMPTLAAENHLRWEKTSTWSHPASTQKIRPAAAVPAATRDGKVLDEVKEVLDIIARNDMVLAAGHLHVSEIWHAAEEAKKRGAKIIAVGSSDWQKKLPKGHHIRHPNGKHLFEYADLKIDDANPFGDADYFVEGYDVPVAPTSTIVDAYIAHRMVIEAVAEMKKRGLEPPIFRSANLPGGDEFNAKLIERYRNRVKDL